MKDIERQTGVAQNTDREIWRGSDEVGDYYADSVFVTEAGGIGINSGGRVVVLPPRSWVALAWDGPNHGDGAGMKDIERLASVVDTAGAEWDLKPILAHPPKCTREEYIVRAVLQAMREPSKGVLKAGATANCFRAPTAEGAATVLWQAMIDHMLSEAE